MPFIRSTLALACLVLGSCAGIQASSDFDPRVDFARFRSFAMSPPPSQAPPGLPGYSEIGGREINSEIAGILSAKGLREVAEEEADLLVSFTLAGESRTDVRSSGPSRSAGVVGDWYGVGWYEQDVYSVQYVVGTLVIDMFDRGGQELVWHGWSSVSLFSEQEGREKKSAVIQAVLDRFPPG